MRRIGRSNALRGKMPSDVQVSGIFALLYDLVMSARFAHRVLLAANVFSQGAVPCFKLCAHPLDVFFNHRQLGFGGAKLLPRALTRFRAAQSRPNELSAFF